MTYLRLCSLLVFGTALAAAVPVFAQNAPPAGGAPGAPGQARPAAAAPANLKVLPKDTSRADLLKLMQQYRGDLGVGCEFCHAQNPETKRNDFASDANPLKETARYMITMTADLNKQYLENMPGRRYADPITCGTCHRGESHPSVFVPKPTTPGGPAAGGPPAGPRP